MRLAKWPRTKSKKKNLNTFEPYKWKGNTQYVDIKKKIVEILSQFKNGHWTKLLARHFLDIRGMIYKQLLFVWHQSVFRTMDINLSQAFPSLVQYKSSNPKIQQAAHISDRVQKKRCTIPTKPLHAAVSISYAVPSKLQYITYDTFMTPWSNRHIYKKAWGWKLGKDKFFIK